ncbi:pilin [Tamilnaduibacter salinus]|uniref:Pilin n=1 Tax=Tamilnaduibacter salinus TaxID=1484056 RepID=A0A2A2I241_9GAMM|nr:pilin [Tamilnaduibacter salinus]PAV26091.1 pilin [Tamilnaduibacter salinus]
MKNIKMNHQQQGFTLIELMIVVAIIGILAAIAIPQYQDYIARTQVNRVYSEISALKTAAEELAMRGETPGNAASLGFTDSNLMGSAPSISGGGSSTLTIQADLGDEAATAITGASVSISRTTSGLWTCNVGKGSAPEWDGSYVPVGCN